MKIFFYLIFSLYTINAFSQTRATSDLKSQRQKLIQEFIEENLIDPEYDTLLDLNYDGHKDFVIGFYGKAGTGIKYGAYVYIYSKSTKSYVLDPFLSSIKNPSFFVSNKKITGFYIGHGAGSGQMLEWIKGKWIVTKEFEVKKGGDLSVWKIHYSLTGKKEQIKTSWLLIPPAYIIEIKLRD